MNFKYQEVYRRLVAFLWNSIVTCARLTAIMKYTTVPEVQ